MSVLTKDGKVFILDGNVLNYKVPPVKGDLINMDLDGSGDKTYRVLKIYGTVAECLAMYEYNTSIQWGDSQNYSGSILDTTLNTSFYSTLNTAAKAAIVPKTIVQYKYDVTFDNNYCNADYSTKVQGELVGVRYVYALDIEDVEEYFGGTAGSASDNIPGVFDRTALETLFWDSAKSSEIPTKPAFRSYMQSTALHIWYVSESICIAYNPCTDLYAARPAFTIDLSKIPFTKTTEVIA